MSLYRTHPPDIQLTEDSKACLETLAGLAGAVAVVTDGPVTSQSAKVEALSLDRLAQHVVLTDKWGVEYRKPHTRAFEYIQAQTAAQCVRCIYIADNPAKDFHAPQELGWATVRVRRPNALHENVPDICTPCLTVTDLSQLPEMLRDILSTERFSALNQ